MNGAPPKLGASQGIRSFREVEFLQRRVTKNFSTRVLYIELLVCSASQKSLLGFSKPNNEFSNFAN